MEKHKFEVKFGNFRVNQVCPVCGGVIDGKGNGGNDVSERVMGCWVSCSQCGSAFPRGTKNNNRNKS